MARKPRGPGPGKGDPTAPPGGDEPTNPLINLASKRAQRGLEPYYGPEVDDGGDDGDPPDGSDVRIAKLEVHVSHIQTALTDIKAELKEVSANLKHLPTKNDLTANIAVIVTIGLTVIAIIVGAMGWLETRSTKVQPAVAATPVQPIIVQVPVPTQPASATGQKR